MLVDGSWGVRSLDGKGKSTELTVLAAVASV